MAQPPPNIHMQPTAITSAVTWLYYDDLDQMHDFFHGVMGLELVEVQDFAKIYRIAGTAFVGAVDGKRGHFPVQEANSVAIAFCVSDVQAWHDHLVAHGITIKTQPKYSELLQVEGFFAVDPGGYTFEIQRFAKPNLEPHFHAG